MNSMVICDLFKIIQERVGNGEIDDTDQQEWITVEAIRFNKLFSPFLCMLGSFHIK